MWVLKLIFKNAARHKLRTLLTMTGMMVTMIAYGLIRTATVSWDKSIDYLSPNRLIVRNAVSFIFDLPFSYKSQIERVPGINNLAYFNWFGGLYKDDPQNFFPSMALGPTEVFDVYPELILPQQQKEEFLKSRQAAFAGQKLVDRFGWHIGEDIHLTSQIYPGDWDFKLVGIYRAGEPSVDEVSFYFHWDYFNEVLSQFSEDWANNVGWYVIRIDDPDQAATVGAAIDNIFKNSSAETLTETEKAFSQSFLSGMNTIVLLLSVMSYLIIGVILLVLANTMTMSARERISEYALLKTLGYRPFHLVGLIVGESILIAGIGGLLGIALAFPITKSIGEFLSMFYTYFEIDSSTIILALVFILMVGLLSAAYPAYRAMRMTIVEGLRSTG